MSVRVTVRGEFRIEPPLDWFEIKDSPFSVTKNGLDDQDVILAITNKNIETNRGIETVISCDRVIPLMEAPYDARNLLEDVRALRAKFEGHAVTGEMVVYNLDEPGDIRRVIAGPDGVREESAQILWPDGTPVALLY